MFRAKVSYQFIFFFLPLTIFGFYLLDILGGRRFFVYFLIGVSLFFYGYWNPVYLGLLLFSVIFNYGIGELLSRVVSKAKSKLVLCFGVTVNLGLLSYYKYTDFFIGTVNGLLDSDLTFQYILLPLAISFFTFQQISYLVDVFRGDVKKAGFMHYFLFVTFFPQLIAGPIVHHKEMLPQFEGLRGIRITNLSIGVTVFAIGLFKKVVLADGIAVYSTPVFDFAESGGVLTFFDAWFGSIAYSLQLYFDFSGYSDMAIGMARMFGIRLPLNFNSPYKALSIIDFWRRWHMTLSRFLRDYLYIPLGGGRKGSVRRYINLMVTMILGGLWHGAGGTFLLWGGMHGSYLLINHWWRSVFKKGVQSNIGRSIAWVITMLSVVVAWVPFRAESMEGTMAFFRAMFGGNGLLRSHISEGGIALAEVIGSSSISFGAVFNEGIVSGKGAAWILVLLLFVVWLPNTQQIMRRYKPALQIYKNEIKRMDYLWLEWRPLGLWAIFYSLVFMFAMFNLSSASEFLYFQF